MSIRYCVIPAAGLGTRFLPATKVLPKELLPVLDRPVIEWGVEEARAAGVDIAVIVLSQGKELIASHFDRASALEELLARRGKQEALEQIQRAQQGMRYAYVYQGEPLGLGHAVLQAEPVVGGEPFACLLPDDLSHAATPVLAQLVAAYEQLHSPILALMRVSREQISRFGCATVAESRGNWHRVIKAVEKPAPDEAESDLAIMGRYVLPPSIFPAIRRTRPGAGGEIQLTDAVAALIPEGEVWGVEFEGQLLDVGTPAGWLATQLTLAPSSPTFAPVLEQFALGTAHEGKQ